MAGSNACAADRFGRTVAARFRPLRKERSRHDRCDSLPALSPAPAGGRDLPWRGKPACRPGIFRTGAGARPRWHRRRRREGDRRRRQHLDLADRRRQERLFRRQGNHAAIAAGFAVRGILRRVLQEPPRRSGRRPGAARRSRARPTRSAPASSSTPRASSSPTTTSSRDADEITVIINDGTTLKAEVIGKRREDRSRGAAGEARQAADRR